MVCHLRHFRQLNNKINNTADHLSLKMIFVNKKNLFVYVKEKQQRTQYRSLRGYPSNDDTHKVKKAQLDKRF